jgi:hypothetical protein
MLIYPRIKTRRRLITPSGGALTANSVNSSHIIDGTIGEADIADGSITEAKFDPQFVANLTTLENKVLTLEQTSVTRSFDTIISSPVPNLTIPLDLVNNESVEIVINMKITGFSFSPMILSINSASLSNQEFDEYVFDVRYGTTVDRYNKSSYSSGIVTINALAEGFTVITTIKIYRSHVVNDPPSKYQFDIKSIYTQGLDNGVTALEAFGMTNDIVPSGLLFKFLYNDMYGPVTNMTASYSIINDKRRTILDGALS